MRLAGLPAILGSRYGPVLVVQSATNLLLALWLYQEYTHNAFMQTYLSGVWASIWPEMIAGISGGIVAVAFLAFYWMRQPQAVGVGSRSVLEDLEGTGNLARLDMCPFCEAPLKPLSEGRLQCRKCRRYFKSSLPKVAV